MSDRDQISTVQFATALNYIYPGSRVLLSGIISGVLTVALGFGGLLQFGYLNQLGGPEFISNLSGVETFAIVALAVSVATATTGYWLFGLLAPDGMKTASPTITNPLVYIFSAVFQTVILTIAYAAVTYLGELVPILGTAVAAVFFVSRFYLANYIPSVANTPNRIKIWGVLSIVVPVTGLVLAFFLGRLPEWTYSQWSVVLMYGVVGIISISGPIDMINNKHGEVITEFTQILVRRDAADQRRDEVLEAAPEPLSVEIPEVPEVESINDAAAVLDQLEEQERWLNVYEEYVANYTLLNDRIDDKIKQQAATGEQTQIDTVVATLAEQLHPRHYDDPESAGDATDTFSTIVESYSNEYVSDTDQLPNSSDLDSLLQISGPQGNYLEKIGTLFRPVQTV